MDFYTLAWRAFYLVIAILTAYSAYGSVKAWRVGGSRWDLFIAVAGSVGAIAFFGMAFRFWGETPETSSFAGAFAFVVGTILVLIVGMALYVTFPIWRPGGSSQSKKTPAPPTQQDQ